jgi:hypothetical protein
MSAQSTRETGRGGIWTPAQRAHTRRVMWAMLAYVVILPPLVWYAAHHQVAKPWAVAMAIAASLPLLGVFASWGRYLSEERDEYQRMMVVNRIVTATNVTMVVAVVWGFLQAFDAMALTQMYWIPVVWVVAQGFAPLFSRNKG